MNCRKIKLIGFAFMIFLSSFNCFSKDNAIIYFIPFDVKFYSPIFQDEIPDSAFEIWHLKSNDQISELEKILKSGESASINESGLRTAIFLKNDRYYIDSDGVAALDGAINGIRINKFAFYKFRDSLGEWQREIRVNSSQECKISIQEFDILDINSNNNTDKVTCN